MVDDHTRLHLAVTANTDERMMNAGCTIANDFNVSDVDAESMHSFLHRRGYVR